MTGVFSAQPAKQEAAGLVIHKKSASDRVVALAGNPNVGKSTVFNALTGMRQHTGNWPGKTVMNAQGACNFGGKGYVMVDVPGCYSLSASSAEEEAARDFICYGQPDAVAVICDAACLERSLTLALQVIEAAPRVVVGVNLMDEAAKKGIRIDLEALSKRLGVPVVGLAARSGEGIDKLMEALEAVLEAPAQGPRSPVTYPGYAERALERLAPLAAKAAGRAPSPRRFALQLLEGGGTGKDPALAAALDEVCGQLEKEGITPEKLRDDLAESIVRAASDICGEVLRGQEGCDRRDRLLDRLFTSRLTGFPIMLLLLFGIFWLTLSGANIPSALLADGLFWLEGKMAAGLLAAGVPEAAVSLLIHGGYRVMAWVVSVMLPPMAIFFPLFTLLEDFGYLPRVAFNLDRCFKGCRACGKQSLTMCMGLGCNAAGVTGCRIIESPRERLIAIITNSFIPCNGRFPMILSLTSLFFASGLPGAAGPFIGAAMLVGVLLIGVGMTLLVSRILSATVLRGMPSSFTLELPPYRRPQVGKVIVRSVLDRTLKVLLRAVATAVPAGLLIWLLANVQANGATLLAAFTDFLEPLGRALGMDGVVLAGFLLGLPANEIVIPVIVMAYTAGSSLAEISGTALFDLLAGNGWTPVTAFSVILFSLMHWPCATTCLTIFKETRSVKWTLLSILIPTACGMAACFLVNLIF